MIRKARNIGVKLKIYELIVEKKKKDETQKNRPEGRFFSISSENYLASAFTLRARRDFLRAAQFLWNTWLAAAMSIVLQAAVRRDFASSTFPASTASRTRREAVRTRDFSAAFFARRLASDFKYSASSSPPSIDSLPSYFSTLFFKMQ